MTTKRIENLVKSVHNRLQPVLEFDRFYAALYSPIESLVEFPWVMQDGQPIVWDPRPYQPATRLPDSIIQTRTSHLMEQEMEQELKDGGLEGWPGGDLPQSWLAVPMIVENRAIGAIVVENRRRPRAFGENGLRVLTSVARQTAQAIENARLYEHLEDMVQERTQELQKRTEQLEVLTRQLQRQNEQLEAVQEIGVEITSQLELEEALGSIVEHADNLLWADFSTLFPYHAEREEFGKGIRKGEITLEPSVPSNTGYSGRLAQDQVAVFVEDAEDEPSVKPTFIENKKVKSFAGIPLLSKGKTVGVLYVNYLEHHSFSEEERNVIRLLANQAAVAIENATLFEEKAQALEEKAQALKLLREQQGKTVAANKLAMVNIVAAEFVHRMNNIAGTTPVRVAQIIDILDQSRFANPQITRYLEAISSDVEGLLRTAKEIRSSTATAELELVDVSFLVSTAVQRVTPPAAVTIIERCETNLPKVLVPSGQLVDTLENLVRNGVEVIEGAGTVTVAGRAETLDDGEWVVIEVTDTGRGIPADQLTRIGELFFTTKKDGGMGFGVWRAKTLIESLGGKISVSSEVGRGTVFTIQLPKAKEA